jgi:hypothetical protein
MPRSLDPGTTEGGAGCAISPRGRDRRRPARATGGHFEGRVPRAADPGLTQQRFVAAYWPRPASPAEPTVGTRGEGPNAGRATTTSIQEATQGTPNGREYVGGITRA